MLVPRDYQQYVLDCLWAYLRLQANQGKNPLIVMPTGTGKSPIPAWFAIKCLKMNPYVKGMVVTHVKELIQQNFNKFNELWPGGPAGVYSAGLKRKEANKNVTYCGVASIAKLAHVFGRLDFIFVDEAHMINPKESTMYMKFFNAVKKINPNVVIIGLTATPWRQGLGPIWGPDEDTLFDDVCADLSSMQWFNGFINQGYLMPLVAPKPGFTLDTTGVHVTAGEYNSSELEIAINKTDITIRALRRAFEIASDRKSWLVFASGVQHCKDIVDIMQTEFGMTAAAVYDGMGDTERDQTIADFKAGKIRALVNNNILTTGFDHPGLDLIICLRPTLSVVLWVQMLGRGTRPLYAPGYDLSTLEGRLAAIEAGGKENTMVLDFAGNARKLGPINDPVVPRKKGQGKGEAPIKECPHCGVENHASARFCGGAPAPGQLKGYCGGEFVFAVKIQSAESTVPVMATAAPIVETLKVDVVQYRVNEYHSATRRNTLCVTYVCGYTQIQEVLCFNHDSGSFPRNKANAWWRKVANMELPQSVEHANELISSHGVATPTHIKVRMDGKYKEVLAMCFDGTAFNTIPKPPENDDDIPLDMHKSNAHTALIDDDIPF